MPQQISQCLSDGTLRHDGLLLVQGPCLQSADDGVCQFLAQLCATLVACAFLISDGFYAIYQANLLNAVFGTLPVIVSVTIARKIVSKEASRIYDYLQYAYPEIIEHQKAVIAFGLILQEEIISSEALSKKLQLPESDRLRSYVDMLCTKNVVLTLVFFF